MPEIIGPFTAVSSSVPALEAHVAHLRHLTNTGIALDILRERFQSTAGQAREAAKLIAAHVGQSLAFHEQSRSASPLVRPVLQYYCYLNLAVAAILSYRPINFNQYRRHGVEDRTHALSSLELSSIVVLINRGAVPLFHSIVSGVSLYGKRLRLGQLAAGFQMVSHELVTEFGKVSQPIRVDDQITDVSGSWFSEFSFKPVVKGQTITPKRLEAAMPLLSSDYRLQPIVDDGISYRSIANWNRQSKALRVHKANGLKLVNFGGHSINSSEFTSPHCVYFWRGVTRIPFLPTLSSILLMSFSLASVARYRPVLLQKAMASPIHLLIETFVQEADGVYIPSLRNLLYREEVAIGPRGLA
ncbi:MAG: hypothetical protein BBJ57_09185 [Desulfobacterales bacterium PC51MH44]|nr:MAG: hypothetical protein BBJ57_09185 [Desulfobacterales bacterium PC51MH44]